MTLTNISEHFIKIIEHIKEDELLASKLVAVVYVYFWFFTMCASCLATRNVWGYLCVIIGDLCTFVTLSLGSRFGSKRLLNE